MADEASSPGREWPTDYARTVLQFLALDPAGKRAFLPAKFKQVTFHMQDADALFSNPFKFMGMLAADCLKSTAFSSCITCDDQVHLLLELSSLLSALDWCDNRARVWELDPDWDETWAAVGRLAKQALNAFGWELSTPIISCAELLDEYSYGAYSEITTPSARG